MTDDIRASQPGVCPKIISANKHSHYCSKIKSLSHTCRIKTHLYTSDFHQGWLKYEQKGEGHKWGK